MARWQKATEPFNPNARCPEVEYDANARRLRLLVKYGGEEQIPAVVDEVRDQAGELVGFDYSTQHWFAGITEYMVLDDDFMNRGR